MKLPVNTMVGLPHPRSRDSQGQFYSNFNLFLHYSIYLEGFN